MDRTPTEQERRSDSFHHAVAAQGRRPRSNRLLLVWLPVLLGPAAMPAGAQDMADFFRQNCSSCHTIGGGRLVGPDLKDVTQRRDRDWLVSFILNPQAAINRGDAYARQLLDQARGVVMPTVPGITRQRARGLLDLIEAESKLEKSQFAGVQISDRPFTPDDLIVGRELFLGVRRLQKGGPACVGCHTVRGIGGLGGGRLGPDLTKVYERIGGRQPLAAWLVGPATTTMRPVFQNHPMQPEEILPLVAYFQSAAQQAGQDDSAAGLTFFLIGLGGTILGLAVMDAAWKRRFRAVRGPLVHGKKAGMNA